VWVTVYTDASFVRRPRSSGWAAWLKSERGRIVKSGPGPDYIATSNEAEMAAIYAGVYLALRAWGDAVRGILVCSDCQSAMAHLAGEASSKRPGTARLAAKFRELLAGRNVVLRWRWVKGHQRKDSSRPAWLNVACDRLAGEARSGTRERP
jgi:ribonuclease HI